MNDKAKDIEKSTAVASLGNDCYVCLCIPCECDEDDRESCCINGHLEDCESLEPAWSLDDLWFRSPCSGCCPNGCKSDGLQRLQDETQAKMNKLMNR